MRLYREIGGFVNDKIEETMVAVSRIYWGAVCLWATIAGRTILVGVGVSLFPVIVGGTLMITGTSRPIRTEEKEIMTIAAEIARRRYNDDVSEELDEIMVRWAVRLKTAYDAMIEPIRIRRDAPRPWTPEPFGEYADD